MYALNPWAISQGWVPPLGYCPGVSSLLYKAVLYLYSILINIYYSIYLSIGTFLWVCISIISKFVITIRQSLLERGCKRVGRTWYPGLSQGCSAFHAIIDKAHNCMLLTSGQYPRGGYHPWDIVQG